jgi:hypothetical protein
VSRTKLLAPLVVAAATLLAIAVQPLTEPWWIQADPDGAYVGSALNLLQHNPTVYLDHPGIPNQEALALVFGGQFVIERIAGRTPGVDAFVAHQLLHLDGARALYRGFAIAVFVLASLAVYAAVARWFRHRGWGVLAGVAFASTPALAPIAFMTKPDPAVSALALIVAVLTAAAFERRSAGLYLAAAAALGLALTVKIVAVGLVAALALALLWRPPDSGWSSALRNDAGDRIRCRRRFVVAVVAAWLALCVAFNLGRHGGLPHASNLGLVGAGVLLVAVFAACAFVAARRGNPLARRVFHPFYLAAVAALLVGMVLPATLILDQLPQVLLSIWQTSRGSGLNSSVEPFQYFTFGSLAHYPLLADVVAVALAVAAAATGFRRGVYWPTPLALGAVVLVVEAAARLRFDLYYAPAFAVSLPGALWLLRTSGMRIGAAVGTVAVAVLFVAALLHPRWSPGAEEQVNAAAHRLAARLGPGAIAVPAASLLPIEEVRYDTLVVQYTHEAPAVDYRFVQADSPRILERGIELAYYTGPLAEIDAAARRGSIHLAGRTYAARKLPLTWHAVSTYGVLKLGSG